MSQWQPGSAPVIAVSGLTPICGQGGARGAGQG